jgi:hypothetical protein
MLTAARKQPRIHRRLLEVRDGIDLDPFTVSGIDDRCHRMPRHALRRDLPR